MEQLDKIFENFVKDEVITEEVKKEMATAFSAMVMEAAEEKFNRAQRAMLEEYDEKLQDIVQEYDNKFDRVVQEHNENTQKQLNDYLKYAAEEFVQENKLAIQNSIAVHKAKDIIHGIQRVFEEHGISLPDSNDNIVGEMNQKNEEIRTKYNSTVQKNIKLTNALEEAEKAIIFMRETSDLSDVSRERLMNMMSGLVVESTDDFQSKIKTLKKVVSESKSEKVNKYDYVEDKFTSEEKNTRPEFNDDVEDVTKYLRKISKIQLA